MSTIYLIRTWSLKNSKTVWIAFDERAEKTILSKTKKGAVTLWASTFGPISKIIRYEGECSPSTASMTMASHARRATKEKGE